MASPVAFVGRTLGHYRILEQIGSGGMGVVFRARDERLDRDVALKLLPPDALDDENARRRFRKEALALSRLNHPNVATVHDFDTCEGIDFLVTELIPGITLDEKLSAALPQEEVIQIGMQLADGLQAAHQQGVIHRDLKPANLRLSPEGRLKILDFGLAKRVVPVDAASTQSAFEAGPAGTLAYMAPEQLQGEKLDARADLWAAGLVLYELATGQHPFKGLTPAALTDEILHGAPPSPQLLQPRLSPRLAEVVLKCLEKDPENRYQSAKELGVDLRRLGMSQTTRLGTQPARRHIRSRAALLAGLAGVLFLAAMVGLEVDGLRNRLLGRAQPQAIRSLAVLPLENLSPDPQQEYFADGMTEALITELSQITALRVISRTSVMQYKNTRKPLPEIAKQLDVDVVVEGSVQRSGNEVGINVQLIHARTDRSLWAKPYERDLRDVLSLQREIARAIASEIRTTITAKEQSRLAPTRPVDPEAYDAYLRGRYHWNRRRPEDLGKSVTYFQQAIDKDPTYAPAFAGLADAYNLFDYYRVLPGKVAFLKAKTAASKAVELDSTLADAYTSLAYAAWMYDWNWLFAETELKRAIELNPKYSVAHHWYAFYLQSTGRFDEATSEMKQALALDPLSLAINRGLATGMYYTRQYDLAIEQYRRTAEMDPDFPDVHHKLGMAYLLNGMHEVAITEIQKAVTLSEGNPRYLGGLGYSYAVSGKPAQARKILLQLQELSKERYVSPYDLAIIYLGLGKRDQAFQSLEEACVVRSQDLLLIKVDPVFEAMRQDARFADLLRRIGLPQ